MKLTDIKSEFHLSYSNKQYQVYSLSNSSGNIFPRLYYCNIESTGNGKFKLIPSIHYDANLSPSTFEPTSNFQTLKSNILEYINSLQFSSEIYKPDIAPNCFYYYAVSEYLKKINFTQSNIPIHNGNLFANNQTDIYGKSSTINLCIFGIDPLDEISDTIVLKIYNSDLQYISLKTTRSITDIINSINTLLLPLYLSNTVKYFNASNNLSSTISSIDNIEQTTFDISAYSADTVNYKQQLINKLESLLTQLKQ